MMFGEYYPNLGFAKQINLSLFGAMGMEAFGTFLLVLMIFFLTEKAEQIDNLIPVMIGATVLIIITLVHQERSLIPISAGYFSPALRWRTPHLAREPPP